MRPENGFISALTMQAGSTMIPAIKALTPPCSWNRFGIMKPRVSVTNWQQSSAIRQKVKTGVLRIERLSSGFSTFFAWRMNNASSTMAAASIPQTIGLPIPTWLIVESG